MPKALAMRARKAIAIVVTAWLAAGCTLPHEIEKNQQQILQRMDEQTQALKNMEAGLAQLNKAILALKGVLEDLSIGGKLRKGWQRGGDRLQQGLQEIRKELRRLRELKARVYRTLRKAARDRVQAIPQPESR